MLTCVGTFQPSRSPSLIVSQENKHRDVYATSVDFDRNKLETIQFSSKKERGINYVPDIPGSVRQQFFKC